MFQIYIASKNSHKIREYQSLLSVLDWQVRPLPDEVPDCKETGESFEANAVEKAVFYSRILEDWVLADDSGLAVSALGGEPGVFSARYAGTHGDDAANNRKLLGRLESFPENQRIAEFICSIALWNGQLGLGTIVTGRVEGKILHSPRGNAGFGYDPLFEYPPLGKSFAELTASEKNEVSHRFRAVQALTRAWREGLESAFLRGQ